MWVPVFSVHVRIALARGAAGGALAAVLWGAMVGAVPQLGVAIASTARHRAPVEGGMNVFGIGQNLISAAGLLSDMIGVAWLTLDLGPELVLSYERRRFPATCMAFRMELAEASMGGGRSRIAPHDQYLVDPFHSDVQ